MKKATGTEAIGYLVSHSFYEERATITEVRGYIDVDNAGRRSYVDNVTDYKNVMWTVLNYMPQQSDARSVGMTTGEIVEGLYSAELEEIEIGQRTAEVIKRFHIYTDFYDSESLGTTYEFNWEV